MSYEVSEVSTEDALAVKSRSPGWEAAWGRIYVALVGRDGQSGRLVEVARKLPCFRERHGRPFGWDHPWLEEFVAEQVLNFQNRANAGTLLQAFEPEMGDVVSFLCSRIVLSGSANRFCGKTSRTVGVRVSPEVLAEIPDQRQGPELQQVSAALESIRVAVGERIDRTTEQAGLQLYPRLDRKDEGVERLVGHVLDRVVQGVPLTSQAEAEEELKRSHVSVAQQYQSQLDALARELEVARKKSRLDTIERKMAANRVQAHFWPLVASLVGGLLGVTQQNAEQLISRYRRGLPALLPELAEEYRAITEYRARRLENPDGPRRAAVHTSDEGNVAE